MRARVGGIAAAQKPPKARKPSAAQKKMLHKAAADLAACRPGSKKRCDPKAASLAGTVLANEREKRCREVVRNFWNFDLKESEI